MYKMILSSVVMLSLFSPGLPSLTSSALGAASGSPAAQVPYGWHYAGKYRSYYAAYRKAEQLEAYGYRAYVQRCGYYYCVYYR